MSSVKAPPIYEQMVDDGGKATLPYILFFNSTFIGDTGIDWLPLFTNLTQTGVPTITGRIYKISKALCYFRAKIVPATNTSSTAGTTYINNFPLTMSADGACIAVSGLLGTTPGMCDQASNRIYVPAWSAVTVPLTIIGMVEAK